MPRSKGNVCPSCKTETKRQLNGALPLPVLPKEIKGTPLTRLLRETPLTKAWCQHLSSKDTVAPVEYVPGEAAREIGQHNQDKTAALKDHRDTLMGKKNWIL